MSTLSELTTMILAQMPPQGRFREEDADAIQAHKTLLLSMEDKLVQGFYDALFAHPATSAVFSEDERPAREETLRQWWRRTISGPFDHKYWSWQALVGLIHVKRGVKNPMMIAMWGWVLNVVQAELSTALPRDEAESLMNSFLRLAATVQSLTAESYLEHYVQALSNATGFEQELLDRLVYNEVDALLRANR